MTRTLMFGLLLLMAAAPGLAGNEPPATETELALQARIAELGSQDVSVERAGELLTRFYTLLNFELVWDDERRLDGLISALKSLEGDGLDPDRYGLQTLLAFRDTPARDISEQACRDIAASHAYLQGLIHLKRGRIDPEKLRPMWRFGGARRAPSPEMIVLRSVADINDPADAFDRARPDVFHYREMRQVFLDLKRQDAGPEELPHVPPGRLLQAGDRDERVPLLRERLELEGYLPEHDGGNTFDEALDSAVRQFQSDHHLGIDGIVGPATLGALNARPEDRLDQLRINLERRRWLAHEMESRLLLVDIAAAEIHYLQEGKSVWSTRSQVGRATRPTPTLRSEVTHFTFNPTWTVPPTIFRHDKLPEIRRDLHYLDRNRLRVIDHSGRELSPQEVNWSNPQSILLRQDAGPGNALGQVAIRFPNPFIVYLHDTPNQRLFERDQRTFSSGCVRVENALELVDLLIADDTGISRNDVSGALKSGRTRNISLHRPIPVLMAYWTVTLSDDGTARYLQDVYQRDGELLAALNRAERRPPLTLRCGS